MKQILTIDRLGRQGDGIAETVAGQIFVPYALPGETVEAEGAGERRKLAAVLEPSPGRAEPVCRHFGTCGGCQMQHMERSAYLAWKRSLVAEALEREGIETELRPILPFGDHARRRVVFTGIRAGARPLLGFSERGSNRVVDLAQCPVLLPEIERAIPMLRELAGILSPRKDVMKLSVVACQNGLDVAASNGKPTPERAKQQAIEIAARAGFARLTLDGETLIAPRPPVLAIGKALVTPPPEAFVQAVAEAEAAMAGLVTGHLQGAKHAADLFAGFGAFALRMAENSTVLAVESSAAALDALTRGWRETGGRLKELRTERRDLFRSPVTAEELKKTGGLVFDPPRAGAEAQARQIAASAVPLVAAVSCNAVTLARDLRILANGGYRLLSVTPVDQFLYTPHVEAVALLER